MDEATSRLACSMFTVSSLSLQNSTSALASLSLSLSLSLSAFALHAHANFFPCQFCSVLTNAASVSMETHREKVKDFQVSLIQDRSEQTNASLASKGTYTHTDTHTRAGREWWRGRKDTALFHCWTLRQLGGP